MDEKALRAAGYTAAQELAANEARRERRERTDARRSRHARFAIGYSKVVTLLLLALAVVLAATGNADTAALVVALALVTAVAGVARYLSARWAGRL